jgi:hypothetical protein
VTKYSEGRTRIFFASNNILIFQRGNGSAASAITGAVLGCGLSDRIARPAVRLVVVVDGREHQIMQTIGLVDCDSRALTSMSSALEREGYEVITYTDGYAALGELKIIPPDLVILAIQMPGMDGMETAPSDRPNSRDLTCL